MENGNPDANTTLKFIQQIQAAKHTVQEQLEKTQEKYKYMNEMHWVDHQFQVGDKFWLYINKERLKGEKKEDQTD